jgi:hypothetical protein
MVKLWFTTLGRAALRAREEMGARRDRWQGALGSRGRAAGVGAPKGRLHSLSAFGGIVFRQLMMCVASLCSLSIAALAHPLDTLAPRTWYEVPNSHVRTVEKPASQYSDYNPATKQSATYNAIRASTGARRCQCVEWRRI